MLTRRGFVKMSGIAAAAVSAGGLLSACGASRSSSSGEVTENKQVVMAMPLGSEPEAGFDPIRGWGDGGHGHEPLIQSTLVTTDEKLAFQNDLATSYAVSSDGLSWEFKIRSDVKFTDDKPLTARDVAFTFNTIMNTAESEVDLSFVKEVSAPDDQTAVFSLNKPFNALLYLVATIGIVPQHAYGADYGSNPIGSGRYKLEQWDKGQQAILVANPGYYGEAPKIERVVVLFMEEDAALAAVQSGKVDVAYTSAVLSGATVPGYSLEHYSSVDSRGISLPMTAPGTSKTAEDGAVYPVGNAVTCDLSIRRAINYGLDRQKFVDNILNGYGSVAYSVGDGMPWSSDDMKCKTDVAYAKEILASGGWSAGADGVLEKDGVRAAFDLFYPANDKVRQSFANEFANQMKDLGIAVNLRGTDWDEIFAHGYSDPVVWGWGTNSPLETNSLYRSTSEGNYAGYVSEACDAYLDAALAQPNVEASFEYWKLAQWDGSQGFAPQGEAAWVWLANIDHLYFVREGLHIAPQKPHPHGHGWSFANNIDRWTW